MVDLAECRRVAASLEGATITRVMYVGLYYENSVPDWDFGDWHWPEVGVQFITADGREFYAIWDHQVANHELTLAHGNISNQWKPLREDPEQARMWNVSSHTRWKPFIGKPLVAVDVIADKVDTDELVPVAVRLVVDAGTSWIVVGQPTDKPRPNQPLLSTDMFIGGDEIIVCFTDPFRS